MDIFGIGLFELIIIGLVLIVVAGPQRSLIWAREVGRYVSKFRQYASAMIAEFEDEVGPEGRELLDVAREFRQQTTEIRNATSGRGVLNQLNQSIVDDLASANPMDPKQPKSAATPQIADKPTYTGWTRPEPETEAIQDVADE